MLTLLAIWVILVLFVLTEGKKLPIVQDRSHGFEEGTGKASTGTEGEDSER